MVDFFTLITTLFLPIRSGRQNKKALNVDINFRALEKREELFTELEHSLVFFTDNIDSKGKFYLLLKESEMYDAADPEENNTASL